METLYIVDDDAFKLKHYNRLNLFLSVTAPGDYAVATRLFPAQYEIFTPETEGPWLCHSYGREVSKKTKGTSKQVCYSTKFILIFHCLFRWHLGMCNWDCTPTYRGFDSFFGFYHAKADYYSHISCKKILFGKNTSLFLFHFRSNC